MNELHLFAGAGGGILGGKLLGHSCVCAVEIEDHARGILLRRQRDGILDRFPIWDDITTFDATPWKGQVDIVCGGFPCQDISCANFNAKGLQGQRSWLWTHMFRCICDIRPRFALVENSPMLTLRGLGGVLGDLASVGYDAQWCVLGADTIGLPHLRKRIWILAYTSEERREDFIVQFERLPKVLREWTSKEELILPSLDGLLSNEDASLLRAPDGVADWVDRIERIGNGQCPGVAALAFRILSSNLIF